MQKKSTKWSSIPSSAAMMTVFESSQKIRCASSEMQERSFPIVPKPRNIQLSINDSTQVTNNLLYSYIKQTRDNMQGDPPKKKKRYILASQKQQKPSPPAKQRPVPEAQTEGKALERSRFDYSFEEIVNHLLARLLPNSNFTIKLSERLIFGEDNRLDDFVMKLDNNIKCTVGITIELEEDVTKEDIDYKMNEKYRGKTFNEKLIEMSVKDFFDKSKYERDYARFLKQFQEKDPQRLYVRLNRIYLEQFLEDIKQDAHMVQKEQEEEQVEQTKRRGNRTVFKSQIASLQIEAQEIDLSDVSKFFNRSQKLDYQELTITKNRDKQGTIISYKFSLFSYQEDKQQKLEAFNYYFLHENIVMLPIKDSKHKDEICKQYGNIDESHLKTKVLKGFKSSKWEQKSLLYKIRTHKISSKPSNYTNEYFQAIYLRGLLPSVRDIIDELQRKLNEVPLDDVKVEIFIDFSEKIKDYIRDSEDVQTFLQKYIHEYVKQFSDICEIDNVKFPLRGVKVNLIFRNNQVEQLETVKNNIQKVMPKYIVEQKVEVDFSIDQQFLDKLQEQGILVVDHKEKNFIYLTSTDELGKQMAHVQRILKEFQTLEDKSIQVLGLTKKEKYLEIIQNMKRQKQQYTQLQIIESSTEDKIHYIISIFGPRKKTGKFYDEVQKSIEKIQRQFGQYTEFINEKVGKWIIQDQKIQQKIQKDYNISLIVSPSKVDAFLELCRKKTTVIIIMKSKNLQKMPLGCTFFFDNRTTVSQLKQKYLQRFQTNVKRIKQNKWHQQTEKTRNYSLFFKENFQISEMIEEVLKIWNNKLDLKSLFIGLILPKVNPKIWLGKLIDQLTLDKTVENISLSFYILDPSTEAVQKLVGIPEYSPFSQKEQIQVTWFCDKKPYTQKVNTKINDAIANGQPELILDKDDFQSTINTHTCHLDRNTISQINNLGVKGLQIPFTLSNNQITFTYKNHLLKFPKSEYNKVVYYQRASLQNQFFLSLPFYLINLSRQVQINIFSNYERPLDKVQNKIVFKENQRVIKAFYHKPMTELIYCFIENEAKQLYGAARKMEIYMDQLWIKEEVWLGEILDSEGAIMLKKIIDTRAQEFSLKYDLDPSLTKITVETCDAKDLERFKQVIKSEIEYLKRLSRLRSVITMVSEPKYPSFWQPQKKEVQTFEVPKGSAEFFQVQNLFGIRPILSLIRIQNKIIYKRYSDQLQHLAHLNAKIPQEKKLFHGTHKTPSEMIWADKEDGFNINYSSDSNLLGRGIYFAQKSAYSQAYASKQYLSNNVACLGMMLCSVIVGDSQDMVMSQANRNVKDTNQKPNGMRYQSVKGVHTVSDIYVVYKNRRAYPLYLIKFQ